MKEHKQYLVLGAGGHLGDAIARWLRAEGHDVAGTIRGFRQGEAAKKLHEYHVEIWYVPDVSDPIFMEMFRNDLNQSEKKFDGIIYCVGHCPPGGMPKAIKWPLSKLPFHEMQREVGMHVFGVLNTFQQLLDVVNDGGSFVFLSSAITRIAPEEWPDFLKAHHHAGVIAAEDWLVRGMRDDPTVRERKIKIHRIAPGAVDTPFHAEGPRPPRLVSVAEVVMIVMDALQSETVVDRQIVPA